MLVRKLRLERGWSQETLAEVSGLSVRTIQRVERGGKASLETLGALAAAFDLDVADLTEETMHAQSRVSDQEREALEYVRDIKGFYNHLAIYVIAIVAMFASSFFMETDYPWYLWPAFGWGLGVLSHGLSVFEVFSFLGPNWERRQVEKRLGRDPGQGS